MDTIFPAMQPSGTIVFQAADPGTNNMEPDWHYSTPYVARGADQKLYGSMPSSAGPRFSPELALASYVVGFVQPRSSLLIATNSSVRAAANVSDPMSLALLGGGLAAFA